VTSLPLVISIHGRSVKLFKPATSVRVNIRSALASVFVWINKTKISSNKELRGLLSWAVALRLRAALRATSGQSLPARSAKASSGSVPGILVVVRDDLGAGHEQCRESSQERFRADGFDRPEKIKMRD